MCYIWFKSRLDDSVTWMNNAVNPFGYNYYAYVDTFVDDGITIGNDIGKIIKWLEVTYVIQVIKGIHKKNFLPGRICLSIWCGDILRVSNRRIIIPLTFSIGSYCKVCPRNGRFLWYNKVLFQDTLIKSLSPIVGRVKYFKWWVSDPVPVVYGYFVMVCLG